MARRARHAPGVLRAAAVGLLAGLAGAGLARAERAPTTTATPMGLVIPLYFPRDYSEWARVAEAAARIPVVAVVSDNYNTPGRKVDPKLAAAALQTMNIRQPVIGVAPFRKVRRHNLHAIPAHAYTWEYVAPPVAGAGRLRAAG